MIPEPDASEIETIVTEKGGKKYAIPVDKSGRPYIPENPNQVRYTPDGKTTGPDSGALVDVKK